MTRFFRAVLLLGTTALFISCDLARKPVEPGSVPSFAPAKNVLYISGPDQLTMSEYEALRSAYPKLTPDTLVELALGSQWLARSWKAHGDSTALREAARCVRATLRPEVPPSEMKEATALLSRAFGISSLEELKSRLKQARQNRVIEWNPDLVREYGLQAKP